MSNSKSAFTIMELIIVVVIIGVLAAIALPGYRIQMLKMKNQEAIRALMALWEAQKDYFRDNGFYADAIDINKLAIDIPPLKNFPTLEALGDFDPWTVVSCSGDYFRAVGYAVPNNAPYILFVLEDGRIVCDGGTCPYPICKKMGFPDW